MRCFLFLSTFFILLVVGVVDLTFLSGLGAFFTKAALTGAGGDLATIFLGPGIAWVLTLLERIISSSCCSPSSSSLSASSASSSSEPTAISASSAAASSTSSSLSTGGFYIHTHRKVMEYI